MAASNMITVGFNDKVPTYKAIKSADMENARRTGYMDLTGRYLYSFPEEVLELENIHSLILSRNKLKSLPACIGKLVNLTELHLDENDLVTFPYEFSKLHKLNCLVVGGNNFDRETEAAISRCKRPLRGGGINPSALFEWLEATKKPANVEKESENGSIHPPDSVKIAFVNEQATPLRTMNGDHTNGYHASSPASSIESLTLGELIRAASKFSLDVDTTTVSQLLQRMNFSASEETSTNELPTIPSPLKDAQTAIEQSLGDVRGLLKEDVEAMTLSDVRDELLRRGLEVAGKKKRDLQSALLVAISQE